MCRANFFYEWCAVVTTNDAFTFLWTLSGDIIIFPFRLPSLFDLTAVKRTLVRFYWKSELQEPNARTVHLDPMRRSLKLAALNLFGWPQIRESIALLRSRTSRAIWTRIAIIIRHYLNKVKGNFWRKELLGANCAAAIYRRALSQFIFYALLFAPLPIPLTVCLLSALAKLLLGEVGGRRRRRWCLFKQRECPWSSHDLPGSLLSSSSWSSHM